MRVEEWLQQEVMKLQQSSRRADWPTLPEIGVFFCIPFMGTIWAAARFYFLVHIPWLIRQLALFGFFLVAFIVLFFIDVRWSFDRRLYRKLRRKYRKTQFTFTQTTYETAGAALKKFTPDGYVQLKEKYGHEVVDLLIITGSIAYTNTPKKLQRILSLKAIEQNREAGYEDEKS